MNVTFRRWASLNIARNASLESTRGVKLAAPLTERSSNDIFGTLSESGSKKLDLKSAEKLLPDDQYGYDKLEFDLEPRKNAYYYKYDITKYARQGPTGIRRALELFQEMKEKARLEPTVDNFSPLIYGCAISGYTKRAFELYDESLRYLSKPTNSVITCLINACAECPFPEYGIERLKWFLTHLKVNHNRSLNEIQYNTAIKAYGKLGQLDEASKLVQEMIDNDVYPTIDTFNMLLIGCASNRQAGCSLALRVFKRIKMYEIKPNIHTYKFLLRCIRDCDMGSEKLVAETLDELPAMTSLSQQLKYQNRTENRHSKKKLTSNFVWTPLLTEMGKSFEDAVKEPEHREGELKLRQDKSANYSRPNLPDHVETCSSMRPDNDSNVSGLVQLSENSDQMLPNLLSDDHLSLLQRIKSIKFDRLKRGSDRLLLFGGLHGYLGRMMDDGIRPDVQTLSLLLECLAPTRHNCLEFHKLAQKLNIKRDLLYYDLLMKHICHGRNKNRLDLALYFVEEMNRDHLRPNISTFEALASGCNNWFKANILIADVERCGFIISEVMIAEFFRCAMYRSNFEYLDKLIAHCIEIDFSPNKKLVDRLENLRLSFNERLLLQERAETSDQRRISEEQVIHFERFQYRLDKWLKEVNLKEDDHPWAQFEAEHGSKNQGYREYVKHMKAATQLKQEAQQTGDQLGNLFDKARKTLAEE